MVADTDFAPEWALDQVYIGTACDRHCGGRGHCFGGMMCTCDEGYSGPLCAPTAPLPSFLKDGMDDGGLGGGGQPDFGGLQGDAPQSMDRDLWQLWSGGHLSSRSACGQVFTSEALVMDGQGSRALVTQPLDLSHANTIQFYIQLGCNKDVKSDGNPPVFLQYSNNGGVDWTTIEHFMFGPNSNKAVFIAKNIPHGAMTNSSQIRWWQPRGKDGYADVWALDQIYIGGNNYGSAMLQDGMLTPLQHTWLEHPGARLQPTCGSLGLALHFTGKEKERYASTADVSVNGSSVLQFELSMGCDHSKTVKAECFNIQLGYSLDKGQTWAPLVPPCLPSSPGCGQHMRTHLISHLHTGWTRVTVPVPSHAWSAQTRFSVYQAPGFKAGQDWAVMGLYVGGQCPQLCTGHGQCRHGYCVCDPGWEGEACSTSTIPRPKILVEDFESGAGGDNWVTFVGGHVDPPCRPVAAGMAAHFVSECARHLQTKPLDLRGAQLIQFYFLYGCHSPPRQRDAGVLVELSVDGGISWTLVTEMHFNLYRTPTFVSLKIPVAAKKMGAMVRWWQPSHGGHHADDWLIDGIRINGEEINPDTMTFNFTDGFELLDVITADHMEVGGYCGRGGVAIGKTPGQEPSTLATRELAVLPGHVLQFDVNVACGRPWDHSVQPVKVQFSTNHGMTWTDLGCQGKLSCDHSSIATSNYHGVHDNWRRIVLSLTGVPISNGTRFRWQQLPNGLPDSQDWAVGGLHVGPPCPSHCGGHGSCDMGLCHCDPGHEGDDCSQHDGGHAHVTQIKDSFNSPPSLNTSKWSWGSGVAVQRPCEPLVEAAALTFTGPGVREVVTVAMDLRNARFVQYTASMWSKGSDASLCLRPPEHKVQSVDLQFSSDAGVTWTTLHTLSPRRYFPSMQDYIPLPTKAKTENTLIRWIQSEAPINVRPRVHWALDNVYIGGSEVNPSHYLQEFDEGLQMDDPNAFEFSPHGAIKSHSGQCTPPEGQGSAMLWQAGQLGILGHDGHLEHEGHHGHGGHFTHLEQFDVKEKVGQVAGGSSQMFTTNQMIVQKGYMLQFKIIMGCDPFLDLCAVSQSSVQLEFRRDPSLSLWQPVESLCLPGSQLLCNPLFHHRRSHYTVSQVPTWTRTTISLPENTYSGSTQFRWRLVGQRGVSWALDDIYVGPQCPEMCRGRGDCRQGLCHCDTGYHGPTCLPNPTKLPKRLSDSFEGGIFKTRWSTVSGGDIGFGCGALLPFAFGKTLYFNGCGERQVITAEMDTTNAIKIIFVVQIGCSAQTPNCNVNLSDGPEYRGVLLQYSSNKGSAWHVLAQHDPQDFLKPGRVAYDVPRGARGVGVQFRWWQPGHGGQGHDQWALDSVEIVSARRHFRRRNNRRGRWKG